VSDLNDNPVPTFTSSVDAALEALSRDPTAGLDLGVGLVRSTIDDGLKLSKLSRRILERSVYRNRKLAEARAKYKPKLGRPKTRYWKKLRLRRARQRRWYHNRGKWNRMANLTGYNRFLLSFYTQGVKCLVTPSQWDEFIDPLVKDEVGYKICRYNTSLGEVTLYDLYIKLGRTVLWEGADQRLKDLEYCL